MYGSQRSQAFELATTTERLQVVEVIWLDSPQVKLSTHHLVTLLHSSQALEKNEAKLSGYQCNKSLMAA